MFSQLSNIKYCRLALLIVIGMLLLCNGLQAQTYVSVPMTGTPAAGSYYSNTSIVLNAPFSFTAAAGSSLQLYIANPDCIPLATALPVNQNYIATYIPRVAGITNPSAPTNITCQVMASVEYIDGLGRPIQTVEVKGSPSARDIVQPIAYDQFGREVIKYLPYVASAATSDGSYKSTAITDQATFYNNPTAAGAPGVVSIPIPGAGLVTPSFAQTGFEPSPLNRVVEQGAPGAAWQFAGSGDANSAYHTVKTIYTTNNITALSDTANTMLVAQYAVTINSDQSRTLTRATDITANFGAGQLYVTVMRDENWKSGRGGTTEEYKDKEGHVVLKRTFNYLAALHTLQMLSTYYVYDDLGNLAFVLTPGSGADAGITSASNQIVLDNLCYQYQYDSRNRLVQKKLPGKGWEYMVYNSIDQVVATQDANQRALSTQIWLYSKYDAQGRLILTGIWNNGGTAISRAALQNMVTGFTGTLWESPVTTGAGYTNTAWPATPVYILTLNYYDNYNFPGNPYSPWSTSAANPTGLLTASKVALLNPDGTYSVMLWSAVNYYDGLGRLIQRFKQHYLNGVNSNSNYDETSLSYDFTNEATNTTMQHFTTASTTAPQLTIGNAFYYDHEGRKTQTWEAITSGANLPSASFLLSQTDYNEIGQVMTKHLHQKSDGTFFQDIAYTYNERGWLKTSSAPLFAMQLNYNDGTTPQYNGNISNQLWGTPGSLTKNYGYRYDNLNRLVSGMASTGNTEKSIAYDNLGNIIGLQRYLSNTEVDGLKYNYLSGTNPTNQLQSITDSTTNDGGMKHGSFTYAYDGNGNMTTDNSKGLTIAYNLLNLPRSNTITGTSPGTVNYTYDANGNKLRRVSTQGTGSSTDYIDGIEYDAISTNTPTITFVQTEEGRALPNGSTWNYEYNLADHLGNSRLSFDTGTGTAKTEQQDDYMPFGMDISIGTIANPQNYYLYNKKEFQAALSLYDYGARFYDPVIARWISEDPKAELGRRETPYGYAFDNPLRFTDPDGMWPSWLGNFAAKTENTIKTAYHEVKNAYHLVKSLSKIKAEAKVSIGLQARAAGGPLGKVDLNVASFVTNKFSMSIDKGKIVEAKNTIFNKTTDEKTGKVTFDPNGIPIVSSISVQPLQTGFAGSTSMQLNSDLVSSNASSNIQTKLFSATLDQDPEASKSQTNPSRTWSADFGIALIIGVDLHISIPRQ